MRWSCLTAALLLSTIVPCTHADEVQFKNGDRLTGTIETMDGGKMVIKSAIAGKLTVDMKDVRTFSSDGPIAIKLNDGTIVNQKVNAGQDGSVALAAGGALQPQNVPLASIKYVNFKEDWTGSLTVGGTLTRGNTSTETLNLSLNAVRRTEKDRITMDAGFLYGRQRVPGDGKHETENDWFISGKYDYFFSKKFYGYANARVERDLIAGVSLRLTPGAGVGYDWYDRPDFHFRTEGGVSWLYRDFTHDGGTTETVALRLAYHIDKKLNDTVSLFHNVEYYPGLDRLNDYFFTADAGIRANLTDRMFSEFKVQEQYDAAPAPGKGRSDTRFILGVGWSF